MRLREIERYHRAALALVAALTVGCRARPTQVTLLLNSDLDRARPFTLSIVSVEGERSVDELRAARAGVAALSNRDRTLFPGSVALVPRQGGPRAGEISLLATLDAPEFNGAPPVRIERLQRLAFIERSPQQARIYFDVRCSSLSSGCRMVDPAQCTLSQRCIERNSTCGDDGVCVALELPTVPVPPEVALDAELPMDATRPRDALVTADADAAREDATRDADAAIDAAADVAAEDAAPPPPDVVAPCGAGFHRVGAACVADGGARPIVPISLGDVTLRRPTLRFALPAGADGAVVELCRDRACSMIIQTLRVTGESARPATALPAANVVFWRARARVGAAEDTAANSGPTWLFHTPAQENAAGVDRSFNPHFDVNADGFDDVVVGTLARATASVYHGSTGGIGAAAAVSIAGSRLDQFARTVANAGDLNGDGFADLAVAAYRANPGGRSLAGTVSVYFGSATGIAAGASRVLEGAAANDYFGYAVSTAGDANADGYADLVVGAIGASPGGRSNAGAMSLFYGSPSGVPAVAALTLNGPAAGDYFGLAVASAGDVNADGYSDVIVGADLPIFGGATESSTARVYLGSSSGLTAAQTLSTRYGEDFGHAVASAGDVNGDGYSDVIVGAYRGGAGSDRGTALVFHGGASGVSTTAARVVSGSVDLDRLGWSVASAGDVNGDGYADVIVGATATFGAVRMDVGRALVFHGSSAGIAATPALTLLGATVNDYFGGSVAGAGDVNRDGYADVIVGAYRAAPGGRAAAGTASVFRGSATGVVSAPARVIEGATAGEELGHSVASGARARRWIDGAGRGEGGAEPRTIASSRSCGS